jgi:uncharacterized protein YdeI (YjbR/CyaY-like superfamily)
MSENIPTVHPESRAEWRAWLEKNHTSQNSVWLVYNKVKSGRPILSHTDAIDEALCFGWIDSKGMSVDDKAFKVCFTKRKPKSMWSKINKEKIERLIEQGLMTEPGMAVIEIAKKNGSWNMLDEVEELIIPEDMQRELDKHPKALAHFQGLSRSNKRAVLLALVMAKKEETRQKRIADFIASV